tara:strand:- start:228 stop:923 length:696 start_codon:yes stop_codon:yes gene_type:complete
MIYFHKILPLLTAPISIVMFLLVIGAVMRKPGFSISSLLILFAFSNPLFADWAIRQAEKPFAPINVNALQKSDFVVVLSGDVARFETALQILENGKADKMIVTAGKTPWEKKQHSDGHQYINVAKQRGINLDQIMITEVVHNTEQEVAKILEIIPIESHLTLVTSAVHMTRAKMLFEKAGFNIIAFPIKFFSGHKTTPMSFIPSALALHRNSKIYREFQGRLFYHLKHLLK